MRTIHSDLCSQYFFKDGMNARYQVAGSSDKVRSGQNGDASQFKVLRDIDKHLRFFHPIYEFLLSF